MKKLWALVVLALLVSPAMADDRDLTYKGTRELSTFSGTPATGDKTLVYDASEDRWETRDATVSPAAGQAYSTVISVNPPVQQYYDQYTSTEVEDGVVVLAGETGKVVRLTGFNLTSVGTATAAATVDIECTGGANIASVPIGILTDLRTVGNYTSAPDTILPENFWTSAATVGCPSGEGIQVIATGSALAGSSAFHITADYTWQ